jgi:TolA-binding protein
MLNVATASLNTLPYPAVSPAENVILNQLLAELQSLRSEVQELREENQDLEDRIKELEDLTARERALDRQRLANLEHKEPQPMQKDRGEILRALIAANGGKMLAKEARQKMRLSQQLFSMLLKSMDGYIEIKSSHHDKRKNLLILKSYNR